MQVKLLTIFLGQQFLKVNPGIRLTYPSQVAWENFSSPPSSHLLCPLTPSPPTFIKWRSRAECRLISKKVDGRSSQAAHVRFLSPKLAAQEKGLECYIERCPCTEKHQIREKKVPPSTRSNDQLEMNSKAIQTNYANFWYKIYI